MRVRLIRGSLRLRRNHSGNLLSAAVRALGITASHGRNAGHHGVLVPADNARVARLNSDHDRPLFVRSLSTVVPVEVLLCRSQSRSPLRPSTVPVRSPRPCTLRRFAGSLIVVEDNLLRRRPVHHLHGVLRILRSIRRSLRTFWARAFRALARCRPMMGGLCLNALRMLRSAPSQTSSQPAEPLSSLSLVSPVVQKPSARQGPTAERSLRKSSASFHSLSIALVLRPIARSVAILSESPKSSARRRPPMQSRSRR